VGQRLATSLRRKRLILPSSRLLGNPNTLIRGATRSLRRLCVVEDLPLNLGPPVEASGKKREHSCHTRQLCVLAFLVCPWPSASLAHTFLFGALSTAQILPRCFSYWGNFSAHGAQRTSSLALLPASLRETQTDARSGLPSVGSSCCASLPSRPCPHVRPLCR
jgi:hypothetical protein